MDRCKRSRRSALHPILSIRGGIGTVIAPRDAWPPGRRRRGGCRSAGGWNPRLAAFQHGSSQLRVGAGETVSSCVRPGSTIQPREAGRGGDGELQNVAALAVEWFETSLLPMKASSQP